MKIIILAGGEGARLWPLSRQELPKQFFRFSGELSLLQKTVLRFLNLGVEILIATNSQLEKLVSLQLQEIHAADSCKIIVEPCRKNTGPATMLAVNFLQAKEEEPILVLPSDHLIEPESVFLRFIESIQQTVQKQRLVLFGIRPTRPETGYGYIRIGKPFDEFTNEILSFIEKPDLSLAKGFIQQPEYYWNAGIFAFTAKTIEREVATHCPNLLAPLKDPIPSALKKYSELPDISLDYALIEKSNKSVVCPLPVQWSDVGSWESIYEAMDKDSNQNVKVGNVVEIDTKNCLIFADKRLISTIGLEDLVIVETEDAILISKKGESQKIKQIAEKIKAR